MRRPCAALVRTLTAYLRGIALTAWPLTLILLGAVGCTGGGGNGSQISASDAGPRALTEYDTDKDGALDAKELEACPGLKGALKRYDKNDDKRLSADEITQRLTFLQNEGIAPTITVDATLDGRPLSGATVTLVPEKFLGTSFRPCVTITDNSGAGILKADGGAPSVPSGIYRIEVSKKGSNGQEMIPEKYNAKTTLGQEVAPDAQSGRSGLSSIRLPLTTK